MNVDKPTPTQIEALRRAIADTGRLVWRRGFWTTETCQDRDGGQDLGLIPTWSIPMVTIKAMMRRGWLLSEDGGALSAKRVTELGRTVAKEAGEER